MTLAAHGLAGVDELTLGWLGVHQADPFAEQGRIDAGDDAEGDAAAMHANASLRNQAYGRAVQDSAGKWWLQYWFYYYYNDVIAEPTHAGNHEGDWEMIALGFDGRGVPDKVALAQHADGMACGWHQLNHTIVDGDGTAVRVYPAAGTHATYPLGGVWGASTTHPIADYAQGDDQSNWIVPHVNNVTSPPGWLAWPGMWGNSQQGLGGGLESNSPRSPMQQNPQWNDVGAWADGLNSCDTNPQTSSGYAAGDGRRVRLPGTWTPAVAPEVTATRDGSAVRVGYRFGRLAKGSARPVRMVVRLYDAHGRSFSRSLDVRGAVGSVRLERVGRKVVRARAITVSSDGHRATAATVAIG